MNIYQTKINTPQKIIKQCIKALSLMSKYPEKLSRDGLVEVLIFCVCIALSKVKDRQLMEDTLIGLIQYVSNDSGANRNIDDVAAHIVRRTKDYPKLIEEIVKSPAEFDLKPIYGTFYRNPLTDVHYFVSEPQHPHKFRYCIVLMVGHLL